MKTYEELGVILKNHFESKPELSDNKKDVNHKTPKKESSEQNSVIGKDIEAAFDELFGM